ncbi:MAG: alpha/beta hydrolase-fold protein [Gemmatimonadales bacterium]
MSAGPIRRVGAALLLVASGVVPSVAQRAPGPRFEIVVARSARAEPLTGRIFLSFAPSADPEPRIAGYNSARQRDARVPFFAIDVESVEPGRVIVLDRNAIGFPYPGLSQLPKRDYWVQAIANVYTRFDRADGHTVWAHQDQWEGQRWAFSPGNVYGKPVQVHYDPRNPRTVRLVLDQVIPPIEVPPDNEWVKRIKIRSEILSRWWGQPMYLGATVLLPRGYRDHPDQRYPVVFHEDHFSLDPPFGFATEPPPPGPALFANLQREAGGQRESGYQFGQAWRADSFPRFIAVKLQHPTPFFDDSYGLNSLNNGPYGDAIHDELIPYLEREFRMIAEPWARVMTGGSTGGWISLALQIHYPDYYGGTWTLYPDPVDFRRYQLVDIYQDTSAFRVPNAPFGAPERPFQMNTMGQPVGNVRELSRMEAAQGTRGRSAGQIDAWNAAYGLPDADGYPRRLWDLMTGMIDREVASSMRERGYDLTEYLRRHWTDIGPRLVGKLHVYTGDMDQFYLAPSVYLLEEFLESTTAPYYDGEFGYGRPMKGHGWQPWSNADLLGLMAAHIGRRAPGGFAVAWRP